MPPSFALLANDFKVYSNFVLHFHSSPSGGDRSDAEVLLAKLGRTAVAPRLPPRLSPAGSGREWSIPHARSTSLLPTGRLVLRGSRFREIVRCPEPWG